MMKLDSLKQLPTDPDSEIEYDAPRHLCVRLKTRQSFAVFSYNFSFR